MLSEILERSRRPAAAVLLAWAVLLNLRFFASAGPLWRDEANSIHQACLPGWNSVLGSLQYDSFPVLYPAILRVWSSIPALGSDLALRAMGLLTGLTLLISICLVCRLSGSRVPIVALVLLAVDPVLISEACSIRPYGLTLIALLWAFAAHGMCLTRPSRRWFLAASISSILAAQLSYSSAFPIAAFGLAAAGMALWRRERRLALSLLVPGAVAALTLLPYLPTIGRASSWVALLHYRVDWTQFFASYARQHTFVPALVWIMFPALAFVTFLLRKRSGMGSSSETAITRYAVGVAVLVLVSQVVFVEFMKVPPFPALFSAGTSVHRDRAATAARATTTLEPCRACGRSTIAVRRACLVLAGSAANQRGPCCRGVGSRGSRGRPGDSVAVVSPPEFSALLQRAGRLDHRP